MLDRDQIVREVREEIMREFLEHSKNDKEKKRRSFRQQNGYILKGKTLFTGSSLMEQFPEIKSGSVISAVDLIQGIGKYAGLKIIKVPGATGLANTNYEGKAKAAIEAMKSDDFIFVHVEATDEAGHDGDLELKLRAISYLDQRLIKPIVEAAEASDEKVCIAVLPDHLTPVELRVHVGEPVPFLIWYPGIQADDVQTYDEVSCVSGSYGLLRLREFMEAFMAAGD